MYVNYTRFQANGKDAGAYPPCVTAPATVCNAYWNAKAARQWAYNSPVEQVEQVTVTEATKALAEETFPFLTKWLGPYKRASKKSTWGLVLTAMQRAFWKGRPLMFDRKKKRGTGETLEVINAAINGHQFREFRSPPGSPKKSRTVVLPSLSERFPHDPWQYDPIPPSPVYVELREPSTHPVPSPSIYLGGFEEPRSVSFNETLETPTRFRRKLEVVHACLSEHVILASVHDEWDRKHVRQVRLRPFHRAIFTGDFGHGGRLYTGRYGHQGLRKIERKTIIIDGERCVELDYRAFHARMLHHLEGLACRSDPYSLWSGKTTDAHRVLGKLAVNALINTESVQSAVNACNWQLRTVDERGRMKTGDGLIEAQTYRRALNRTGLTFAKVVDLAVEKHHRITHLFSRTTGLEMMRLDGELALAILHHFAKRGVPCLGVHDSFIVPQRFKAELHRVMLKFYERRFGFFPEIRT